MVQHGSNGSYEVRQAGHNADYEREFRKWVASLTPEEFAEATRNGVDEPDTDYRVYTPKPVDLDRHAAPTAVIEPANNDAQEAVARLLLHLLDSKNVRLEVHCLAYLFGFAIMMGKNETDIAQEFGLCRAAISNRVQRLKHKFRVRANRLMKSDRACATFRLTNGALKGAKKSKSITTQGSNQYMRKEKPRAK